MKRKGADSGRKPAQRVFVDANTIISGLLFEGNEAVLLRLGMARMCQLVTTELVVEEVRRTLSSKRFGLTQDEIAFLKSYLYGCIRVYPPPSPKEIAGSLYRLEDQKDVHVLVAFEKLGCRFLITGDAELLVKIEGAMRTRELLELLFRESPGSGRSTPR